MAKKIKTPFLPVDRSFFETDMWLSKPFTPGQAWIDLNYLAAYENTRVIEGNRVYNLKPGQLRTSLSKLANRWKWSRKRVGEYIGVCKRNALVYAEGDTQGYTLTIEKYGVVGLQGNAEGYTQGYTEETQRDTQRDTPEDISSYYMKNQEIRNKEAETEDKDPRVISSRVDPKTGEIRDYIRP